jgi:DNA replication protein DnaC
MDKEAATLSQEHASLWRTGGFPKRHRESLRGLGLRWEEAAAYFAEVPGEQAKRAAQGLYAGAPVLLLGGHGTGKTTLATYFAWADGQRHARAGNAWSCRYTTTRQYLDDLRAGYESGSTAGKTSAYESRLLVLDEVDAGLEGASEWARKEIESLLDYRYGQSLPHILIGNSHAKRFAELLGPAASDRLRQGLTYIPCTWESYRHVGSDLPS